jgi:Glycosyltransferase family 87
MTSRRLSLGLLLLAALIHGAMLANLANHFTLDAGGWTPVQTGRTPPVHWNRNVRPTGPFTDPGSHHFEKKLKTLKDHEIRTKPLMFVPPRKTDNFGLDLWVRDSNRTDPGGDFFQIYYAGLAAREGLSIFENDPPGPDRVRAEQLKRTIPFHPPNRYPPPFIYTAGVALSYLPVWNAYLAWTILHELVLIICIFVTWRLSRHDLVAFAVSSVMWLAFTPWYLELYMGQTTFLIMAGTFILGAFLSRCGSIVTAGFWWTLTLATKPLTLLYTPLLIRLKHRRLAGWGIGIPLVMSLVYFVVKPADLSVFSGWAFGQEMVSSLGNLCFQNLMYHVWFSNILVLIITLTTVCIGLYFTCLHKPFEPVRVLCLWVTVYFLGYAHVWEHHQVLLLSAVILPYLVTRRKRFLVPWLLAAIPSPYYFFEGHWNWAREVVYLASGTLPVLVLFGLLVITRFDRRSVS